MQAGPYVLPKVNPFPNIPMIVLFCKIANMLPFQPSPYESVIVILSRSVGGHPVPGQNVVKIVVVSKEDPLHI